MTRKPVPHFALRIVLAVTAAAGLLAAGAFAQQQGAASHIRRVVTALDSTGKAVILADSEMPLPSMRSPNPAGELWVTDKSPPDLTSVDRVATTKIGFMPPRNGNVLRIVDFVPMTPAVESMDMNTMMKVVGDGAPAKGRPPKHPMMHRTRTLDYAIILSGEIDLMLDEQQVHLKAGDVVIQQATNHAWINHGKDVCRIAFVLMDSQEP